MYEHRLYQTYCSDVFWSSEVKSQSTMRPSETCYLSQNQQMNSEDFKNRFKSSRYLGIEFNSKFNLEEKITSFNPNLQLLYISGWEGEKLPDLPDSLLSLRIIHSKITKLPKLPSKLRVLDVYQCPNLRTIPDLPKAIQYINFDHCFGIVSLPLIPFSTKFLKCDMDNYSERRFNSCFFELFNGSGHTISDLERRNFESHELTQRVIHNRNAVLKIKRRLLRKRAYKKLFDNTPLCRDLCNVVAEFLY